MLLGLPQVSSTKASHLDRGPRESRRGAPLSAAQMLPEQACAAREGTHHSPRVQICPWQQVSGPQIQQRTPLSSRKAFITSARRPLAERADCVLGKLTTLQPSFILASSLRVRCHKKRQSPSFSPKKDGSGQNPRLCLSSRARPRVGVPMGTRGVRTSFLLVQTAFPNPPCAEKASLSSASIPNVKSS